MGRLSLRWTTCDDPSSEQIWAAVLYSGQAAFGVGVGGGVVVNVVVVVVLVALDSVGIGIGVGVSVVVFRILSRFSLPRTPAVGLPAMIYPVQVHRPPKMSVAHSRVGARFASFSAPRVVSTLRGRSMGGGVFPVIVPVLPYSYVAAGLGLAKSFLSACGRDLTTMDYLLAVCSRNLSTLSSMWR